MRAKVKLKFKYFTVFIFLAILFFINTRTVFAGKARPSGGSSEDERTTIYIPAEDLQEQSSNCQIYITSTDERYQNNPEYHSRQFHLGWKEDLFTNTEDFYNNNNKENAIGKVAWTSFNNVIAYPYIVMFKERWKDSGGMPHSKESTGYLYLYVDSYYVAESAAIWASYANEDGKSYLPLYYQNSRSGQEEKGEAFFGLQAFMTYLPISNIKCKDFGNAYYAQNFTTDSTEDAVYVLDEILKKENSEQALSGWQSWADGNKFLMGNLKAGEAKAISSQYKWVSMFAIGAMGENTYNEVGRDYHNYGKTYKVTRDIVESGFNGLAAELGVSVNSEVFKSLITGEPNKILACGYHGFKDNYQINGVDTNYFKLPLKTVAGITAPEGVSRLYKEYDGSHKLLNGEAILEKANSTLFSGGSYNILDKERTRLSPSKFADAYNTILGGAQELGDANFININGGHFLSRYSWGATVGSIGACQDTWYPRDVTPDLEQNPSKIIIDRRELPGNSNSAKKSNPKTRNFGTYATDNWDTLTDDEKVTNTIIFLETNPWYVPLIAQKSGIGKAYKLGTGAETVLKLNELGANKKTFKDWKKCVIEIGDYLVNHTLTAVFPSTGWSSQSVFGSPDGTYYSVQPYPIFIALTPKTYNAEDLLISNSFNNAGNTANLGGMAGTIHDATARNTIDWGGDPDLGSLTYQGLNVNAPMKKSEDGGYGNPAWDKKNRA